MKYISCDIARRRHFSIVIGVAFKRVLVACNCQQLFQSQRKTSLQTV